MPNSNDSIPAAHHPNGEPMTEIANPAANHNPHNGARMPNTDSSSAALNTNGDPMTEIAKPAANHDQPNGARMPNTDNSSAAHHPNGDPMTEIAKPAANPHTPNGAQMPNTNSSSAALNPNGEPMTQSRTNQATPDNPNPKGPMPPDLPPEDEPIPDTERMITYEDAARAALDGVICSLGCDEVRVLTRIAERLQVGSQLYGPFYLATDARVFRDKEAREELEDALVYLACAWLKAETREVA
jgi:hypothetical protein